MKSLLPLSTIFLLQEKFLQYAELLTTSFISIRSKFRIPLTVLAIFFYAAGLAQTEPGNDKEQEYKKVVTERSLKILNTAGIDDPVKKEKVLNEMVSQYIRLNHIHDSDKIVMNELKERSSTPEELAKAQKNQQEKKASRLKAVHENFISRLKEDLTDTQLEKVKDGMTYSVLPVTYSAYQDMIPSLTDGQKAKIFNWLKEARELAMDEGSSEKKHAVFGKYKGRINNYLSAEGYDFKKQNEDWARRIKERKDGGQK